jgi:WD40 repeat protein
MRASVLALAAAVCSSTAMAQVTVLLADRGSNTLWRLTDVNQNGVIDPDEVFVWYDATNAAGTGVPDNLNALFVGPDGTVIGGDQVLRLFYWFKDLNGDGDALDEGESRVIAFTPNPSGASTTFPTGGAFGPNGDIFVVNAGNANGVDAIYRCRDLDGDGTWMQAGEMSQWVGDNPIAFGPGNGPFSPQEIVVLPNGVGFLRNSSANLHGVYRFEDINGNGRADDDGAEFYRWYTGTAAGFALEPDVLRPGSFYYHQIASGSEDQILRLTDEDGDGNADGPDEAVVVFSTAEGGFTSVDILCLPDGDVLVTDNSGRRIIRLSDQDNDGLFMSPGERTDFLIAAGTGIDEVRQVVLLPWTPSPTCGTADFDGDGDVGTDADIEAFFACLAGNCCPTCFPGGTDFDGDGDTGTDADIEAFFRVLAGGEC